MNQEKGCSPGTADEAINALNSTGFYRCDNVQYGNNPHAWVTDFAHQFGTIIQQLGADVLEVKPQVDGKPNGPFGKGDFPLHTDGIYRRDELCPDLVIMLCVSPGSGGEHLIADANAAIQQLRSGIRESLDALLTKTITFLPAGSSETGTPGKWVLAVAPKNELQTDLYEGPIYEPISGRLRYSTTLMSRLDTRFAELSNALNENAFPLKDVRSGTLWIIDNKRMLHGRKAINSDDRLMLRVHVKKN